MNNIRSNGRHILTWLIGAALSLTPLALASSAQAQDQSNQQVSSGQASPPPAAQNAPPPADAQSSQPAEETAAPPPPPPADAQNGQSADDGQMAAPPPPAANSQDQQGAAQQGQWGPAGPPPDVQNGQVPPPPQDQGYGQGSYSQGRAPYQSYQNQPQPVMPTAPVALPAGTLLQVRTSEPLDTRKLHPGDYFQGTLARGIFIGNMLAIPRGAQVVGRVVDVKKPGDLKGSAGFTLQATSLNLAGQSYPLVTDTWSMRSPGKGGYTAGNAVGGAVLGSVIGAIAGGGPGAAIGAVAGTGAGLGASAATPGPRGVIPAESVLAFHLTSPITVKPITYQEAQQLEQNSAPPQQGFRPGYGYGGYPPPAAAYYGGAYPYPYPYPYVYGYPYPYGYVYARPYPYVRYYRRW